MADLRTQPGEMIRDEHDEWPSDSAIGTFDIVTGTIAEYPGVTAHLIFICPNSRRCAVLVGPLSIPSDGLNRLHVWAWNGNLLRPTLTPSINCLTHKDNIPVGGCGWHGFITNGVIR